MIGESIGFLLRNLPGAVVCRGDRDRSGAA